MCEKPSAYVRAIRFFKNWYKIILSFINFGHNFRFRSPNKNADMEGDRHDILHWESFDNHQKYMEIGE